MNSEGMSYGNNFASSSMYDQSSEYNQGNMQQPQQPQQPMAARPRVDVDAAGEVDPTL